MNRQVAWILTLMVGGFSANAAVAQLANPSAAPRKAATPVDPAKVAEKAAAVAKQQEADAKAAAAMNPILAEWEKRSTKVTSLDAVFDKVVRSPGFGDQWYRGRALLQAPDKACLNFTLFKLDANKKPLIVVDPKTGKKMAQLEKEPDNRIVCTGSEVLQYLWENRTITVYPLDKQVRVKALQEGPLPFLFNMKAAEAKQRYGMWLYKEYEKEYVIDIAPRLEIDRDAFIQARLWLNKETYLPNQLWLVKEGGKEREEYKFNGSNDMVVINQPMDQKYFAFQNFEGWKLIVNKPDNAKGVGAAPGPVGAAAAAPRQQASQPNNRPPAR